MLNAKDLAMKEKLLQSQRVNHVPQKKGYYPVGVPVAHSPPSAVAALPQARPIPESDRMWAELRSAESHKVTSEEVRQRAVKAAYAAKIASQSLGEDEQPAAPPARSSNPHGLSGI
jgi:hypothetical protein